MVPSLRKCTSLRQATEELLRVEPYEQINVTQDNITYSCVEIAFTTAIIQLLTADYYITCMYVVQMLDTIPSGLLLQRDVDKRLGCRGSGADELKEHPFFSKIDWIAAYHQKYTPPLVPPRGEVNAADAFDIGSFDEEDTKGKNDDDDDGEWEKCLLCAKGGTCFCCSLRLSLKASSSPAL